VSRSARDRPATGDYPARVSTASDRDFIGACVQFDVRPGDVAANVAAMRAGVDEAVAANARLCVLPELWSTSFLPAFDEDLVRQAEAAEQELAELSCTHGLVVVGSTIEVVGDQVYNTAHVWQRGQRLGSYRKIHLFSPNLEHRRHAAGDQPCLVESELGRIGVLICYDLRFPEISRYYFHRGAELLVVPGQWPEARAQHWRTLLRARAIENQLFVLGCNRTGQEPSQRNGEAMPFPGDGRIVDPTGEVLAAGSGEAGAIVAPIEPRKVRTMRRILPIDRDQRPAVYEELFRATLPLMESRSRVPHADEHAEDED
jgi:omega-amidase